MKIGILGGSFDPIHIGHITMAQKALIEADLDEIWLIPAGHSPNKNESNMTISKHRYKMCELAILNISEDIRAKFKVSDIEMESTQTSYTYLTLQSIKEEHPYDELFFIMGGDSLDYFDKWCHPEIIAELATILVMVRDGFMRDAMLEKVDYVSGLFPCRIDLLSCPPIDVSSTQIRQMIKNKLFDNLDNYIFPNVLSYVIDNNLYN